jgi:hypothetical protein
MISGLLRAVLTAMLALQATLSNAVIVTGDDSLNFSGSANQVIARQQSFVTILPGADVNKVVAREEASLTVLGGSIHNLVIQDNAASTVTLADIFMVNTTGNSRLSLSNLSGLKRLVVEDTSEVEIIGSQFVFDKGYLSGYWANGEAFLIRTVNLTGVGNRKDLPATIIQNDVSSEVPVPAAAWLFASALVGLGALGRRSKRA